MLNVSPMPGESGGPGAAPIAGFIIIVPVWNHAGGSPARSMHIAASLASRSARYSPTPSSHTRSRRNSPNCRVSRSGRVYGPPSAAERHVSVTQPLTYTDRHTEWSHCALFTHFQNMRERNSFRAGGPWSRFVRVAVSGVYLNPLESRLRATLGAPADESRGHPGQDSAELMTSARLRSPRELPAT